MACIACGSETSTFIDFGRMPLADAFLSAEEIPNEFAFDLQAAWCPSCNLTQLAKPVPPHKMFHAGYAYVASISQRMERHFAAYAAEVMPNLRFADDPFVVEIGSNDGILLHHFADAGIRHLGVEPADNVAQMARDRGVRTETSFFNAATAEAILEREGPASAILAANAISHIADLPGTFDGVRTLLHPDGFYVFEEPYVPEILRTTALDQIYDEHACYFSARAVSRLGEAHGLALVDLTAQDTHGGSMRYVLGHAGRHAPTPRVAEQLAYEERFGLGRQETYDGFRERAQDRATRFRALLEELHAGGKRVAGYAATAKSCTMINYAGIDARLIACIYDTTPGKHGKLSPGAHIPIRPHAEFAREYPEYAVLFAWNHEAEIVAKEREFTARGGRWLTYVPDVRVWS